MLAFTLFAEGSLLNQCLHRTESGDARRSFQLSTGVLLLAISGSRRPSSGIFAWGDVLLISVLCQSTVTSSDSQNKNIASMRCKGSGAKNNYDAFFNI